MELAVRQRFTQEIRDLVFSRYRLDKSEINVLDGFESFIFDCGRTNWSDGNELILRVGHSGRRSSALVQGEIDFINYLADNGVNVAGAIPSPGGNLVETFEDGTGQRFVAVTFRKLRGRPAGRSDWSEPLIIRYGRLLGRIHALTKHYAPSSDRFFRPQWDDPIMHEVEENLTREHQYAIDKYLECCEKIATYTRDRDEYGLVHFDAHAGNFLVDEAGEIGLFDFDDAHYTWFANDIAIVLFYMQQGVPDVDFSVFFMTHFLEGYARENVLDPHWLETIPLFMKTRELDLFALIHRSFDVTNLDPSNPNDAWCMRFLKHVTPRVKNDIPVVDYDFMQLASLLR